MGAPLQSHRFIQQQPQRHRPPPSQAHWYQPMQPPSHHHHQSINSSSPYPTLQPNPYHAHPPQHYNNNHFQMLPPPPHHHHHHHHNHLYSHPSQSYTPQSNNHQTWENGWVHHQGWEHPDRNMSNNGDWAGWAREWAMENQHLPSQFTHIGRLDGHNNAYHDQYEHIVDPRYTDTRQPLLPSSTHQQFSVPLANPHRPPLNYMRDSIPFVSGQSCCYVSDGSYTTLAADSNGVLPHQGSIPMNSSDNQHEVPPSYSSVPGNREVGDQTEMLQNPLQLPLSSAQEQQNHVQPTLSAHPRSIAAEQPHFTCEHHSNEFMTDPSDRPLEFAPGFRSNNCMHTEPAESAGSVDHGHASDRPLEFAPGFRSDNCMHTDPAESVNPGHASEYANGHYNVSECPEKDDKAATIRKIKWILTDVLSKATDELFDEIATRVIKEDGMTVEVDHDITPPNHEESPSPSAIPTHKASAEVQSPVEDKKIEAKGNGGKSSSGFPGDVLGLASYASDDDEHFEAVENGSSQAEIKGPGGGLTNVERDHNITAPGDALHNLSTMDKGLSDDGVDKDFKCEKGSFPATEDTVNVNGGKMVEARNCFVTKDDIGEKTYMNSELSRRDVNYTKSMEDGTRGRETRRKSDKNDDKDFVKEAEAAKIKAAEKHSGSSEHRGQDERHVRKEKTDDLNGLQERVKHKGTKSRGKANESDSRKNYSSKDDIRETEKVTKAGTKDDSSRKRERVKDEKEDRSRKTDARNSSKHQRHHSSSVGSRGRNSEDNSVGNQANESSDEASKESTKRNRHSRKRSLSPPPTKSRRRGRESRSKSPDLRRR